VQVLKGTPGNKPGIGPHIRQVLDIRDSGQPPCVHVTGLIAQRLGEVEARLGEVEARLGEVEARLGEVEARLGEVEARLAELTRTRGQLVVLAARATAQDPADGQGHCSIIAG
jgi:hypothetical protein